MTPENIGELDALAITVVAEDSCLYETPYLAQHGISLLLEASNNGVSKRILMDVAQHPEPLLGNMRAMGINPAVIDAVVLSHCHYDHTRGISRILGEIGKAAIPVIAHPDIFRLHFVREPELRYIGIADGDRPEDIRLAGGKLTPTREPLVIRPGLITSGEVPRENDFESPPAGLFTVAGDAAVADEMADDLSLIANIKDKGLVVITGCAHAGIVNICRQASRVSNGIPLWGIVGGLHLVNAPEEIIQRTAQELSALGVKWINAGHCTGFNAQAEFRQVFGDGFAPLQTGMRFKLE